MSTNSNVNKCKTSCCIFNYYTQTVYNPNPPRLWSRFGYVCPCPTGQAQCSTDFVKLDERRKAEILKYKANSSNITKKQQYANAASNRWLTSRKRCWATQTDTYTNPNTSALQRVGDVLECNNNNVSCSLSSDADVPGKIQTLCYDPTVPLYNYKVTTTYTDGGGKYGLYERVEVVSLSNFNDITKTLNDPPFTFNLTPPTSNSPGAFTYTSSNDSVATILGNIVTIIGIGSCTITATQEAYSNYTSGSISALLTVTVNKITTILSNFAIPPPNPPKTYGDPSFTLNAATSSRPNIDKTPIIYSSSNTSVATVTVDINSGVVTVTIFGVGTCIFTARQAATPNYSEGTATTEQLVVQRTVPLFPSGFSIDSKDYGQGPFTIEAPASDSQGAFTYISSDPSIASIGPSFNQITILGAGTCTITANQAADGNYSSGSISTQFTVNPIAPTIRTFTVDSPQNYGVAPITIEAPASDSRGAFTYISSDPSIASIGPSFNQITIGNAGTCTITANQAADGNYTSGKSVPPANFTVNPIAPTIRTFTVDSKDYGQGPFTIEAPLSDSQGAFTYISSDPSIASIGPSFNQITIGNAGTCTITANQAADGNYTSGKSVPPANFTVNPIAPTIRAFTVDSKDYGQGPFTIEAPASDSQGAFTYTSSDPSIASIGPSFNQITVGNAGTCTITANQAADGNYTSGKSVPPANFTVNPIAPTIALLLPTVNINSSPFSLTQYTTSNSQGGTFSYTNSNTQVATINQDILTPVAAGTTYITAHQTATLNYTEGNSPPFTLIIPLPPPNLQWTFTSPQTLPAFPDSLTLNSPTSNSDSVITLSNADGVAVDINPLTVSPGSGTFTLARNRVETDLPQVTIVAKQAQTASYAEATISFVLIID